MEVVDDAFYRIGTRYRILPQLFRRGQIARTTTFVLVDKVPGNTVTVREANAKALLTGGQGFLKFVRNQMLNKLMCLQ